jgi:hypothetical protein
VQSAFETMSVYHRLLRDLSRALFLGHREDAMKFGPTANSQQVDAMSHVVARYCHHIGIDPGTPEAEHVAGAVLALHEVGIRGENELLKALVVPKEKLPREAAHWG